MYFIGRVTLFFANNFSNGMSNHHGNFIQFFLDNEEVIFSSHTMLINASTKDFTPVHLVTFSISGSLVRMKFYFVYILIRL